jgi:hypothetical protein
MGESYDSKKTLEKSRIEEESPIPRKFNTPAPSLNQSPRIPRKLNEATDIYKKNLMTTREQLLNSVDLGHKKGNCEYPNLVEHNGLFDKREIRVVSMLNSKPVTPYITLLPFKEYAKIESSGVN